MNFLFAVLNKEERDLGDDRISLPLLNLLRHVHEVTLRFESRMLEGRHERPSLTSVQEPILKYTSEIVLEDELFYPVGEDNSNYFHIACRSAASIHLRSLGRTVPFSSEGNQHLVHQLRLSVFQLGDGIGQEIDPEIYIWLCFTGAAAAQEAKTWFLAKSERVIMSLKPCQQCLFKSDALRFCRLLQYLREFDV
jgi:hypothetical protein